MPGVFEQKHEDISNEKGIVGNEDTGGMGVDHGHARALLRCNSRRTGWLGDWSPLAIIGWIIKRKFTGILLASFAPGPPPNAVMHDFYRASTLRVSDPGL
jgi:hypothetical protein